MVAYAIGLYRHDYRIDHPAIGFINHTLKASGSADDLNNEV